MLLNARSILNKIGGAGCRARHNWYYRNMDYRPDMDNFVELSLKGLSDV